MNICELAIIQNIRNFFLLPRSYIIIIRLNKQLFYYNNAHIMRDYKLFFTRLSILDKYNATYFPFKKNNAIYFQHCVIIMIIERTFPYI